MLRPARMCRLDCIIPEDRKSELIDALHKRGITQIEFLEDSYLEKNKIERDRPLERVTEISKLLLRIRKVIDSLSRFEVKPQANLVEDILGVERIEKKKMKELGYREMIKLAEGILKKTEEPAETGTKGIYELEMRRAGVTERIKSYEHFEALDFKIEHMEESKYVYTVIGLITQKDLILLKDELGKRFGREFLMSEGGVFENKVAVSLCVMKDRTEELDSILREFGFERMRIEGKGQVKQILKNLRKEAEAIEKERESMERELKGIHEKHYRDLLVTEELLDLEKHRCEIFVSCGKTMKTVLLRLWVPRKNFVETEGIIKEETNRACFIDYNLNPQNAPILLENPKPLKPFEGLTRLFALPKYNEIDPTILIAPTFCLFFGIMLTDAMYGLFLVIAGLMIRKSLGKYADSAKRGGVIVIGCGLAAIFFGVLTGSYFGDFLANDVLVGKTPQDIALWMDPMHNGNAMIFLLVVAGIGLVHLFSGYLFGAWDSLKRGEKKKALTNYISWYILLVGAVMVILTMFPAGNPLLPQIFMYPGAVIALVGIILLFMGVGFMIFIDLIGIVGSTLSYARLLAMSLTTAGIAVSFNFLARMVTGIPYVGIVVAVIIFIFGHLINILINSLGAFVHSLRLHYVEHFGTYYEGGGAEFKPFKENRKYTYV
ncbi:MAG: V-type ATP synthase subunit I [Candidatus Aenigmatarchaeota archaeon]|nr:MAG: V-type ATP synthase subunit I [Candidatus Aenigmarchaeota archaeon]